LIEICKMTNKAAIEAFCPSMSVSVRRKHVEDTRLKAEHRDVEHTAAEVENKDLPTPGVPKRRRKCGHGRIVIFR
jgi:hypothetical protein